MLKTKITQTDIDRIIMLYRCENIGTHKLGEMFKLGHKTVSKILKDNGVGIKKRGGQITHGETNSLIASKVKRMTASEGKRYVAKCKTTGIVINDPMNLSGALTRHLISLYGDITKIPSNTYQRKKYEAVYGKKWFEEYFDIVEDDLIPMRKCRYCDWSTEDMDNATGCYEIHIKNIHNKTIKQLINDFPEDIKYHKAHKNRTVRDIILLNEEECVSCEICGEKMKVLSNTHLKERHNITTFEYKLQYGDKIMSSNLTNRTAERLSKYNLSDTIKRKQTKPEIELCSVLDSLNIEYKTSNRSILDGKEIDILIEDRKLGIEFNGNIHHTEYFGGKDKRYHLEKTLKANLKGYKLIQIFSDEWKNNKLLVINKLTHLLGRSKAIKIGARKCLIKEISLNDKNIFLEKYHIQGKDSSTIKLGAYFDNILVGVMTFKIIDKSNYDLTRFATNYEYNISGLGSKLLQNFIKDYHPTNIVSFADRRWTLDKDNNLYTKLGFKLIKILHPNYRYYHSNNHLEEREHKFGFRKNILVKKYPNLLNLTMTETEMIKILGYDRIWDCGLFKYELTF